MTVIHPHLRPFLAAHWRQKGLTLIELMVAMAVGLVVVLAVTSLIVLNQTQERNTTGSNDMNQSSAYAATIVDQALRSAGAGFVQGWDLGAMGCRPQMARGGDTLLPRTTALPAPFSTFMGGAGANNIGRLSMAPVLIEDGGTGSDMLMIVSGSAGTGDIPRRVRDVVESSEQNARIRLDTTISIAENSLLLISSPESRECLVTQVQEGFEHSTGQEILDLGGTYFQESFSGGSLRSLTQGGEAFITGLGNTGNNNLSLQIFGVGTDNVLYRYDLLQQNGDDAVEAMSEGVVAMQATYRVDANIDDPRLDPSLSWATPATGAYSRATLMGLSHRNLAQNLRRVVGVRVSLLLRSPARQNTLAAPEEFVMLAGLAGEHTHTLSEEQRHFAHRLVEFTVPLRNTLILQPAQE